MYDHGVYDVVGSIWRTEKRAQNFLFSVPYLHHEIKFIKLRSSRDIQFDTLDDLDGIDDDADYVARMTGALRKLTQAAAGG